MNRILNPNTNPELDLSQLDPDELFSLLTAMLDGMLNANPDLTSTEAARELADYTKAHGRKLTERQVMEIRLTAERAKASTAEVFDLSAKGIEPYIRAMLSARGLLRKGDWRARSQNRTDAKLLDPWTGKWTSGEVKTGGTVSQGDPGPDWTEADVIPNSKLILFPVMPEIHTVCDVPEWTAIFRREDFIELMATCSRNGLRGTIHRTSPGTKGRIPVLAFQPTPLAKLRQAVKELIEAGECPTVDSYMLEHGRKGIQ